MVLIKEVLWNFMFLRTTQRTALPKDVTSGVMDVVALTVTVSGKTE